MEREAEIMARKPEDKEELERWINNPITQWFFQELLWEFDAHKQLLYSKPEDSIGELKGQQDVMKFIRNPGDLL